LNGVSGRVVGKVVEGARRRGLSIARIADEIDIDPRLLSNSSSRIPWESFTHLIDRIADEIGGAVELRRFSEEELASGSLGMFRVVGRVLASPRDVYTVGVRWMGPSLFPMIRADMWERADGVLVQRLTIEPDHRDCPGVFHLFHGALTTLPRAWGHGPAEVAIDLAPRSATFEIRASSIRRGPLSRLIRSVRARFAFPTMLRELEEQQVAIDDSYRELREAHARISDQAADLARVDSIGRELSRDVDLDRVLDALIRTLKQDLGFLGAEIWLSEVRGIETEARADPAAPMRCVRRDGTSASGPGLRYPLEAAGRRLGELVVHRAGAATPSDESLLLARLLPWIALALDNALTYARLERHAEALEERVQERTARLLAANHHLVREMDERKRATDALLQSEAQLRASERLASIGTLAAGIAHEINNPVGAILAAAQLAQILRTDPSAEDQVDTALVDIVTEAKRCGDIVRGVLQFSREERTDKWNCALRDLVIRSIRLTSAFADKHGTRLVHDLPAESPWAHANPTQLEQAIVNLIRNAIESGASEVRIRLADRPSEGRAQIEVRDDGIGISESDRLRILEPFFTTRRATGGTGLGLSVVHGIALEHGATLEIESHAGQGSAISLVLPTVKPPDVDPPRAGPSAEG